MDLTHKPVVLYHASIERMEACYPLFHRKEHVLAAYLSGVAVECILQAIALQSGAAHDARHDLPRWLSSCPTSVQDAIKKGSAAEWSFVVSLWDNGLRYLSANGFLGYLRAKGANRRISGGPDAIVRENTRRLLNAADIIHKKGVSQWMSFTKK